MTSGLKFLCALPILACCGLAHAQAKVPTAAEMERAGLTLAWTAQATVDSTQDEIEFINADERMVIVQTRQGLLTALRTDTGKQAWSVLLGGIGRRAFPAVMNESEVIVAVGMTIFCLNKEKGDIRWQLVMPAHPTCAPEVDARQVYIGTVDGSAYAYDLRIARQLYTERKLGKYSYLAQVWRFKTPKEVVSLSSNGDMANFVSYVGTLYGVDAKEKKLRYEMETNGYVQTELGRNKDSLFLCSSDARMLCLRSDNGRERWAFTSGTPIHEQPRAVGDEVFVVPSGLGLFSLNAKDGGENWRQPLGAEFLAASDRRLYVSDRLKNLLILERSTGKVVQQMEARGFPIRARNELTDRVYLSSTSGRVVCVQERGQSFPIYHRNPDRRPLLPELAPEGEVPADASEIKSDEN
jgi:outer membrane protein assembly factor BamB